MQNRKKPKAITVKVSILIAMVGFSLLVMADEPKPAVTRQDSNAAAEELRAGKNFIATKVYMPKRMSKSSSSLMACGYQMLSMGWIRSA